MPLDQDAIGDQAAIGDHQAATGRAAEHPPPPAPQLENERRRVTVLFADLSGFTALSERLDPEEVRALQEDLFKEWAAAVYEYAGYVEKFVGDAVMAVFGAPVAHEHDPERAVRAALAMRDRMVGVNLRWKERLGQPLALHCGLNTGTVVAGEVGGTLGGAYAVTGDTVNTAARLQAAAGAGEILVGEQTYRLTRQLCAYAPRDPVRARGKAEPVRAFVLVGLQPLPSDATRPSQRSIGSPVVGRDAETALLVACLDGLAAGQGRVVGIIGEPGLGKSRLIAEVRRLVADRGLQWLEGSALSYGRSISYWPFQEMVRSLCGIAQDDDATLAVFKLRQRVETLFGAQTAEALPYLATLLALEVPDELAERVKYLDGDAIRRQVFLTVRRLFEHLARERPTVLVFEDLHWLDQSSATLLDHLLPLVREVPLVIVGLGRPDPDTPAAGLRAAAAHEHADSYTEVRLTPLSDAESGRLLSNLVAVDAVPAHVRAQLLAKTEGNPFFLEEVVRSLVDVGAAVPEATTGRLIATADLEHLSIPDTVQGVIMARIDRLGSELKQVLRLASVVGRTFAYRVVAALSDTRRDLQHSLAGLQELELIREHRQLPELEYMFEHALVQEATYQSILVQRRRELHRQVVTCIETLFADRIEEFYGLLAHHAARAEDWPKAQHYLFLAGDQASSMAADWEALAHYRQAMEAYARAFGDTWDPVERAVLERKIGEALFRRGELQAALEYLYRALALLGWDYPTRRWAVRGAIVTQLARQAAHRILPSSRPAAPSDARAGEERATILHLLSWATVFLDQERNVLDNLLLLNESEHARLPVGTVRGLMALGIICDYVPQHRLSEFYNRRAIAMAEAAGQPIALGQAYLGQGVHEYAVGDWDAALTTLERARATYWSAGELRGWGLASLYVQEILLRRGLFAEMIAMARELDRVGTDGGDRQLQAWGGLYLGGAYTTRGRLDEGMPVLRQSLQLCRAISDQVMAGIASSFLAIALLRRDAIEEACQLVDESNAALDASGLKSAGCVYPRSAAAEIYLAVAAGASGDERRTALARSRRAIDATMALGKLHVEGVAHAACWRGTYEWLSDHPGAARQWWLRSIAQAEKLKATCLHARASIEIGRYSGDGEAVQRGAALYTSVGAEEESALLLGNAAYA